jgi:hypothetical protein
MDTPFSHLAMCFISGSSQKQNQYNKNQVITNLVVKPLLPESGELLLRIHLSAVLRFPIKYR